MYESNISVEGVIYRYFVKYDRLNELISYTYSGSNDTSINIFIDLYGIYHTLFSRQYRTIVVDYVSFTSLVINMCAHYRSFFRFIGVSTKIFIISSFNIPQDSLALVPEYNNIMVNKLQNKLISEMVELNTGLLELICPYLPDIHFIKTNFESSIVMNDIMNREGDIHSLIITTDSYPLQLTAIRNKVSLIWPIKTLRGDESIICPHNMHSEAKFNFWSTVTRKFKNNASTQKLASISPSNLVLLESLNRFPDRCLPVIFNISRSIKLISSIIGYDSIKLTPQILFDTISEKEFRNIDTNLIINRYKTLDIQYQNILYNQSLEPKLLHYENLEDNNAINMINDKYFSNNPIDIFNL